MCSLLVLCYGGLKHRSNADEDEFEFAMDQDSVSCDSLLVSTTTAGRKIELA